MSSILQALAKALGKSEDDVARMISKSGNMVDDIAPQVPMGSGKNLEALQKARVGAPDLDTIGKYPKNIVQDELATKGDFKLVGDPYTKEFTMPHPEAQVPAIRNNADSVLAQAADEISDVGGSLPPSVISKTSDTIEVPFKEIPNSLRDKLKRMDPRLAGLAAAGAGGLAWLGLSGGGEEVPQSPYVSSKVKSPEEKKILPDNYMDLAQKEALEQSIKTSGIAPEPKKTQSAFSEDGEKKPSELDFMQLMMNAQGSQNDNQFNNALIRAANQAGASIAGLGAGAPVKADQSGVDALDSQAGQSVKNVAQMMDTKASQSKLQKMEDELGDEAKLRDPNSSVSKLTKEVLARHGLNIKSAKEAQLAGINVQNIILQELAAKNQREMKEMEVSASKIKKATDLSDKQRKFAQGLRKELTTGVLGKQYATFSTGQRMQNALEQFASDPSGYSDYATLMGGLKVLQGDESVVREAEVRMGMSATSLFDSLQNQLQKMKNGKMLQPEQRQAMINTIKTLTDLSRQQYLQAASPILEQADMEGIPHQMLLSGSLSGASKSESKPSESKGLTTSGKKIVSKMYSASRDKTKLVYDDGTEEIVDGKQ